MIPNNAEYFVPRLIERRSLALFPRERTERNFPERDANSIALYLGLQVVRNGSVAIFVGKSRLRQLSPMQWLMRLTETWR